MHLQIITPEQTLLSQDVEFVTLPGITGEFQILDDHAPIVSTLGKGHIKLSKNTSISDKLKPQFESSDDKLLFNINGGVVECKDNKVIVLVD